MPGNVTDPDTAQLLTNMACVLAAADARADDLFSAHLSEVPAELAAALRRLVRPPDRTSGHRVVRGLLAGFGDPGPTPLHWRDAAVERTRALDIALVLVGAALGPVFGWRGQQDGRLVHNIMPSPGYENLQVGASSSTPLEWHTEDAFHRRRAEVLLLACVRNDEGVGSRVASIRRAGLTPDQLRTLGARQVAILPDASYPDDWRQAPAACRPRGVPTVWHTDDGPCLRYDPAYSRFLDPTPAFTRAYAALGEALDRCHEEIDIRPGDVLLIDNDVAVHGRAAYRPRYNGTDRWLKRVLVRLPRQRPAEEALEDDFAQLTVEPQLPEIP